MNLPNSQDSNTTFLDKKFSKIATANSRERVVREKDIEHDNDRTLTIKLKQGLITTVQLISLLFLEVDTEQINVSLKSPYWNALPLVEFLPQGICCK
ncbi:hypothetical protein TNCT_106051 [Trichonephila clavata]|uniref:Uncharacterized protein n=1 Tax=Trichonephila clavata TaxID=2740835 RepID=A0A8X6GIL2_TRICU|nr:hypothetical protein TNCT_106051 [Trichonephila clavata]